MSLDDIANITITATSQTPTRAGFGTALAAVYHTRWGASPDREREYTSLAGMVADGFQTTDPAYRIAAVMFSQNPRPERIKIGRRASAFTQVIELIPSVPVAGEVYEVTINGTEVSVTADGTPTLAEVCTALATAITALAGVTADGSSGTKVVVTTDAAGTLASYDARTSNLALKDTTTDPGIEADLNAILAADADWYGLVIDSNSEAQINAAAAWAEANGKLFVPQTADSATYDSGSATDVAADLEAAAYGRSALWYHPAIATATSWLAAGILGNRLPHDPGSDTWAYKTVAGVAVYALSETQRTNLHAKQVGTYTTVNGVAITEEGKVAAGEWIDTVRFLDWLRVRMQERMFFLLLNNPKLPYTNGSVVVVKGEVYAQLKDGVTAGGIDGEAPITVTAPKVRDVPTADRRARRLPGVGFGARLAGAIHLFEVSGTVTV